MQRLDYAAISPAGSKALSNVHAYVATSGLSVSLIEFVYLRVSQINHCAYCLDLHTRKLLAGGERPEKLALVQVWREGAQLFDQREQAALSWAETVTRVADTSVPEESFQMAQTVFSEKELVDLTIAISLMNAYNRIAVSFRKTPQAVLES